MLISATEAVQIIESKQLLAEEPGGRRRGWRGRSCRDQILTLILLGERTVITKKEASLLQELMLRTNGLEIMGIQTCPSSLGNSHVYLPP